MSWLEQIIKSEELKGKRIIITGCGYKPLRRRFHNFVTKEITHNPICVNGIEMKLNIGSATAGVLGRKGGIVHMVSTSPDKLEHIKKEFSKSIDETLIEYSALDLLNEKEVARFVKELPKDKPIYWVQSVGLGAGSYKPKNNNPYLPIKKIPLELLEKESKTVLNSTHIMMQALLPIFEKQIETRIAIITSMSASRGYSLGGTHCAAKGGLSRYTNSAMLDLYKERIYITDIRPGLIDTGMYDGKPVIKAVKQTGREYGIKYWGKRIPLSPPSSVGEAIAYAFTTPAHITSLNLVAQGQWPQEGS